MKTPKVKVVVAEGDEAQPVEVMEKAITELASGMKRLNASRLKREAIILLLHDASKVGKPDIRKVLDSLDQLEPMYLKPAK